MLHLPDVTLTVPSEVERDCSGTITCFCMSEVVFSTAYDEKGAEQSDQTGFRGE